MTALVSRLLGAQINLAMPQSQPCRIGIEWGLQVRASVREDRPPNDRLQMCACDTLARPFQNAGREMPGTSQRGM